MVNTHEKQIVQVGIGSKDFTTYDLVSHGKNTAGKNECWGTYNSESQTGWGPAYFYNCIHSGDIKISDDGKLATNWYNYTLATAGTIIDENTSSSSPATNITTATESVCPKGWTLPSKTQIDSQRNIASFSPVLGGNYSGGTPYNEATYGYWWSSTAYIGARRYGLFYNGNSLYTSYYTGRHLGFYVRCVQKSA